MRRADRLFELIHLLRRARRAMTAVQLAEALEVSPRTIHRDIAALMAMRVPDDGAIRKPIGAGAVAFLMNRCCSSGEDAGASASAP